MRFNKVLIEEHINTLGNPSCGRWHKWLKRCCLFLLFLFVIACSLKAVANQYCCIWKKCSSASWYSSNDLGSWQLTGRKKRWKWNKTEVQYCELFSAGAVAKIWLLAHLGRLTDVANHSAVNLLQFPRWRTMNKLGFIFPNGTILYEGPLFLSSPHSTPKNKKKRMHLLSNPTEGHCEALSHSFKFCPDSNFHISLTYRRKHICESSM